MSVYQPYPIIAGPTASGKTALAIALAKQIGGEVVSADSMQVYRDVAVGTARPTEEEMDGVPHHLLGFLPLDAVYSVARYMEDADRAFQDVYRRGRTPVMCGGTGLYIQSFMENIQLFEEPSNPELRQALTAQAEREGGEALLERLRDIDPETAVRLHSNDLHRIIRALEVYETTGMTITEQNARSHAVPSPYTPCLFVLDFRDRQRLYDRINLRVDKMLENGLLEEAERVLATNPECTVTQAIGYKEFGAYFEGVSSLEEAAEKLKQQSRRYAKRQLSWFRRMKEAHTVYVDDYASSEELAKAVCEQYLNFLKGEMQDGQEIAD